MRRRCAGGHIHRQGGLLIGSGRVRPALVLSEPGQRRLSERQFCMSARARLGAGRQEGKDNKIIRAFRFGLAGVHRAAPPVNESVDTDRAFSCGVFAGVFGVWCSLLWAGCLLVLGINIKVIGRRSRTRYVDVCSVLLC